MKTFYIFRHAQAVKKEEGYGDKILTASIFKEEGMTVEINTSGLRKPAKEIYPSPPLLEAYRKYNVPVVFGSDAHAPGEVGQDFDQAKALARKVGYREALVYEQRKVTGRDVF